jgi:hypothetical protein
MKKVSFLIAGMFFFLLSMGLHAQTKTGADFFEGKWSVKLKGLPDGDVTMIYNLEKKDNTLTGFIADTTGLEISKISSVDVTDNAITIYFNTQGYDVNLVMTKQDEEHVTGNLMGMFDAEGVRVKEAK